MTDARSLPAVLAADPGDDGPLRELADALVDAWLDRPLGERADAAHWTAVARALVSGVDERALEAHLSAEWSRMSAVYAAREGALGQQVPSEWTGAAATALARPDRLHAELVLRLLDQPQVRGLVAEVLQRAVGDFARRASEQLSDNRVVGGVMNRARGWMKESVAGGILSAVGEGLNAEAERRVKEFVAGAVGVAMQQVVDGLCDPRNATTWGVLRAGILASALDLPTRTWALQLLDLDPVPRVMIVLRAVRRTIEDDAFEPWLAQHLAAWLPPGAVTSATLLERAGASAGVRAALRLVVMDELRAVAAHPAFIAWWERHVGGGGPVGPSAAAPAKRARRSKKA